MDISYLKFPKHTKFVKSLEVLTFFFIFPPGRRFTSSGFEEPVAVIVSLSYVM